jgi:AraC-like DNA-binding protein
MDDEKSLLDEEEETPGRAISDSSEDFGEIDMRLFGRPLAEVAAACEAVGAGELFELVEQRYADLQLSLTTGVRVCAIDPNLANTRLKVATGLTFHQLLIRRRVRAAAGSLAAGNASSLEELARECGFGSLRSLERNFKGGLGVTPSRFRRLASRVVGLGNSGGSDVAREKDALVAEALARLHSDRVVRR